MGKKMTLFLTLILALLSVRGLAQAGLPAPNDQNAGPLALQIPAGLTPPETHQPLSDWKRVAHQEYVKTQGFDECLVCHAPQVFCNQCHDYVGGAPSIPTATPAPVPQSTESGGLSFTADVLPILQQSCAAACHNPQNAANMGGLNLSDYAGLMSSGNHAPLVIAGDPENSLLMMRLRGEGGQPQMPLGQPPIAQESIETIARWIAAGAHNH